MRISSIYFKKRVEFDFVFLPGTAGDSLSYHHGRAFSTLDRDNDDYSSGNCAVGCHGAWWYSNCHHSNLNGRYLNGTISPQAMSWEYWKNSRYSVTRSEMKIRPLNI